MKGQVSGKIFRWVLGVGIVHQLSFGQGQAPLNTLTPAEQAAGWVLLFDGISNNGWRRPNSNQTSQWVVEDDALRSANGDMCTQNQYGSFEMTLDYKVNQAGNSGVMFHTDPNAGTPYMSGPEIAILDNENGGDRFEIKKTSAAIYDMKEPSADVSNPYDNWNTLVLWLNGNELESWHNGVKVAELEMYSQEWQDSLDNSKFSQSPWDPNYWGTRTMGTNCIQDHGGNLLVWVRNIKLRVITPGEKLVTPLASPAPGTFTDSVAVTLEAAVTGASVFYTLDGSNPSSSAGGSTFEYTTPIIISSNTTLKAITYRETFAVSDPLVADYTVGATPVTITEVSRLHWNLKDLGNKSLFTFTGLGKNPVSVEVTDLLGTRLVLKEIDANDSSVVLPKGMRGIYFLKISNLKSGVVRKVVID